MTIVSKSMIFLPWAKTRPLRPQTHEQKKPTCPNTLRHSSTSVYSLTDPSARPSCPLSSHPKSFKSTIHAKLLSRSGALPFSLYGAEPGKPTTYCLSCWNQPFYRARRSIVCQATHDCDSVVRTESTKWPSSVPFEKRSARRPPDAHGIHAVIVTPCPYAIVGRLRRFWPSRRR
jgi:hypothetical protein